MSVKMNAAIGFAAKAGKVKGGDFIAEKSIKSGLAQLIILDTSASEATKKKWQNACEYRKVPLVMLDDAGVHMGKPGNMVFAVTDEGFAKMIIQAAEEKAANDKKATREDIV